MMPKKLRIIVEQHIVAARVDKAKAEHPYFDEYFEEGLKWWLARKPLTGKRVPGLHNQFAVETHPWLPRRIPPIRLLYSVSDNESVIESMAVYDDDDPKGTPSPEKVVKLNHSLKKGKND